MPDPFELCDPKDAHDFLKSFGSGARRAGEALLAEDRVDAATCVVPGTHYSAAVRDAIPVNVSLLYIGDSGWAAECTCAKPDRCAHGYAVLKSLLAEHSVASVRKLSSGRGAPPGVSAETPQLQALEPALKDALHRDLSPEESRFVLGLTRLFRLARGAVPVTLSDLAQLGLPFPPHNISPLRLWAQPPKSELQFWNFVAFALREAGKAPPAFLEPVTDSETVEPEIKRFRREQEVQVWREQLRRFGFARAPVSSAPRSFDLRVRCARDLALLEYRRPGREEFEEIPSIRWREVFEDNAVDGASVCEGAELIWAYFRARLDSPDPTRLRYQDPKAQLLLGRLLRHPTTSDRVVSAAGAPLSRPSAPLRWNLALARDDDDDYRLQLLASDGSPPPPPLAILRGQPTLYLTANEVFACPELHESVLDPRRENRVPAIALETPAGVQLLESLGLELPPRLLGRIHRVALDLTITCRLEPPTPGTRTEECSFRIIASSPDGALQEVWTSHGWIAAERSSDSLPRPGARVRDGGIIVLYDRACTDRVPEWMAPLELKWNHDLGAMTLRVTKEFPEVFDAWLRALPPSVVVHLDEELAPFTGAPVSGSVRLEATEQEIDWFDLRVVLSVSDTTLTPAEIKLLLQARGRYVRLEGRGWRRLEFNISEEEDEHLARLGLSARDLNAQPQRLHALQLADEGARRFLPDGQHAQVVRRAGELKARVQPPVPGEIKASLRPYQLEGFHFLAYLSANRFGGILADDMGLGKTVQTLTWLVWLRQEAQSAGRMSTTSLVVCPKSVMDNWRAEAARFAPGLRVRIWQSGEIADFVSALPQAEVHVVHYAQLRLLGPALAATKWQAVVLDEGQYIKNPNSQTAQIARNLSAEYRLILTGTPIENRLLDLWSLMAFAMPGMLGGRTIFSRSFDAKEDPWARKRLAARLRPFVLRRTKSQVATDLPDRIEEDLYCEIEGEQQMLYRAELKRARQLLLNVHSPAELALQQFHFLTSLLRLRQICCHPRLVNPTSRAESAKLEALLEQLEPLLAEGNKVLIFSQFVELLKLVQPALAAAGWPVFVLTGDTEDRGDVVASFQAATGPAAFLISLKAGGFGLNLTAASYVVLFDPWWNPAVESQAIDRAHRIGQTTKVIAYRLLIKGSIEEKIRTLQQQKKSLAQDVLGEERFSQQLTLDDFRYLLSD